MYLEDPVEVLLRKPPPATAAPFLKRVQFLFEGEDSVQNYAKQDAFDGRYVIFFPNSAAMAPNLRNQGGAGGMGGPGDPGGPRGTDRSSRSGRPGKFGRRTPTISQTGAVPFQGRGEWEKLY